MCNTGRPGIQLGPRGRECWTKKEYGQGAGSAEKADMGLSGGEAWVHRDPRPLQVPYPHCLYTPPYSILVVCQARAGSCTAGGSAGLRPRPHRVVPADGEAKAGQGGRGACCCLDPFHSCTKSPFFLPRPCYITTQDFSGPDFSAT